MSSTTTSSTVPYFPTRNFENSNNPNVITNKASSRSLSQKAGINSGSSVMNS